jgi:hypothetical protein
VLARVPFEAKERSDPAANTLRKQSVFAFACYIHEMKAIRFLAAGSITDSDFISDWLVQVIASILIWLAGVYVLYTIVSRMFPRLNIYIRSGIALILGIILASLFGFITEIFQT